jgi:outer membrane protein OmpA-like peptidoglycan-associated protein
MQTLSRYCLLLIVTVIPTVIVPAISLKDVYAQGWVRVGDQVGCGTNPVQDWYLVDNFRPYIQVNGTIAKKIKLNRGGIVDDGDWNICLKPASGEEYVLTNSIGDVNEASGICDDDGLIELEVCAGPDFMVRLGPGLVDLPSIFPVGTQVTAYGQWVEDAGHGSKTELHPLQWMMSKNANPFWIWVAQDNTARFATWLNWAWLDLPLPVQSTFVRPGAVPPSATQILHEHSRLHMDVGDSAEVTQAKANIGLDQMVHLHVHLDKGPFNNCEFAGGGVIITEGSNYLGRFELSSAPLLRDTISVSVVPVHDVDTNTDHKAVNIKVTAELNSPPQGQLAYSKWRYETNPGFATSETVTIRSPSPHRRELAWTYRPWQGPGWGKACWTLDVVGSTRPEDDSPTFDQIYQRTFVGDRRIYRIDPSTISLGRYDKDNQTDINLDKSKLFPGVALKTLAWEIKTYKNADGTVPITPELINVTPSTPVTRTGFSAQLLEFEHPIYRQLRIRWDSCPNRTQLFVRASGETELGEPVIDALIVSAPCGIGTLSYWQIREYFYRVVGHKFKSAELYKVIRSASPEDRRWLEAFGRWEKGEDVTPQEGQLILEKVREGENLPPVKWKKTLKRRVAKGTQVAVPLLGKDELLQKGQKLILKGITFKPNEATLDQGSIIVLKRTAMLLKMNPNMNVEIAVYTDNTGSSLANRQVSERRALAVKRYLVDAGIDPSRLTEKAYGELDPIASNDTEEGRALNRRIELHIR